MEGHAPHLPVSVTNRALAWRGPCLPPGWSGAGREGKGGMGRPCRWGLLARGSFCLSLLGGVWLDGLWHPPLELREDLPIHVPPPLSVSVASALGTAPFSSSCPHFLARLPQSSPTPFLNLTNLLVTLCFLASPLHMPFSLPGMSPPLPTPIHISGLFENPAKTHQLHLGCDLLRSFLFVMYSFALEITRSETAFRLRKISRDDLNQLSHLIDERPT